MIRADLTSWIQALKGEVERASDSAIRALVENPSAAPVEVSGSTDTLLPSLPHTAAAIRAAISDTFTFSDIASQDSEEDERAILANADTVMIAGKRRLRLNDEARARLLSSVMGTPLYQGILLADANADAEQFESISDDEIRRNNAWLRCFLLGQFGRLDRPPASELRSALCAREHLTGVKLPESVPSVGEVRRMLGLAELLEPLRILIGSAGGWDGVRPLSDRFVGRETELSELRAFVDELASRGAFESVSRGGAWLGEKLGRMATGRVAGVWVIAARGGLGKSSLVAKFMLDHAIGARKRFPFAYLDFDRAALQPREPRQLLLEVMRQVALQFPEMGEVTDSLSQYLRNELQSRAGSFSIAEGRSPVEPFVEFREMLQHRVTRGSHAFLLVLDTMEAVQIDPRALEGVVKFVNLLCTPQFPEARIVLTGRADVPELRNASPFRGEGKLMKLAPLAVSEAREMASSLGRLLLGTSWQSAWSNRIAGTSRQPGSRREPLTVRVAVDLVRSAEPKERNSLTQQIEKMGEEASGNFVGALYQRRVLDHVRDPEVKKLAWPGLVLRRVTLEIVSEVLAEPCQLNRDWIYNTFQALSRETWIVDRDGDALRHQPDLRARTLPLMRRKDPAKFALVNQRAIDYFGKRQSDDLRCRAEWLYHRLMAGESVTAVESDWTTELAQFLAGADADFPPGSDACSFLFAHTATRLETGAKSENLDVDLSIEHIANTAPYLASFDEERLSQVICDLPLEDASPADLSDAAYLAYTSLAVKTGRWGLVETDGWKERNHPTWRRSVEYAQAYFAARAGMRQSANALSSIEIPVEGHRNFGAVVQRLAFNCLRNDARMYEDAELILSGLDSGAWRVGPTDRSTLRTAMLFSAELAQPCAAAWYHLERSSDNRTRRRQFSAAEIRALSINGNFEDVIKRIDPDLWEMIFDDARRRRFLVVNDKIGVEAQSILQAQLSRESRNRGSAHTLQHFAAARDEDWIAPMAYAAFRATSGVIPASCIELANSYTRPYGSLIARIGPRPGPRPEENSIPTDILQMLLLADRAGDLPAMATLFADEFVGSARARDLNLLLREHKRWRDQIDRYLAHFPGVDRSAR